MKLTRNSSPSSLPKLPISMSFIHDSSNVPRVHIHEYIFKCYLHVGLTLSEIMVIWFLDLTETRSSHPSHPNKFNRGTIETFNKKKGGSLFFISLLHIPTFEEFASYRLNETPVIEWSFVSSTLIKLNFINK